MSQSILEQTSLRSPIQESSAIKPKGGRKVTDMVPPLMLTPLIDAFSLLVIYLLLSYTSSGEFMMMSKDMHLPVIGLAEHLERQIIIKFESGTYFVEDQQVTKDQLFPTLLKMREDFRNKYPEIESYNQVIIQADKKEKFLDLNHIIHATAQAGFEEIKFAVIRGS